MSATSSKPSIREWLPRLISGQPHMIIGGDNNPYMLRWYVIPRNPLINVYVHKFLRSDDDRALHDHPWWFVSLMLSGMYTEVTEDARTLRAAPELRRLFAGWRPLVFRPAKWRHRVELIRSEQREIPCWTLIVTGPRQRVWGFWCKDTLLAMSGRHVPSERFVPWTEFGDAGCGETA